MQTYTQKKKLSKGTWALIILLLACFVAVVVLAAIGYISLTFLSDWLVGTMMFGSEGWVNALIVLGAPAVLGALACWAGYRWFIGQKVTIAAGTNIYTPQTGASNNPATAGTSTEVT